MLIKIIWGERNSIFKVVSCSDSFRSNLFGNHRSGLQRTTSILQWSLPVKCCNSYILQKNILGLGLVTIDHNLSRSRSSES